MRRILLLVLSFILCLCFCGCGENAGVKSLTEDDVIGTWYGEYTAPDDGIVRKRTLEIYKGGTGHMETYDVEESENYKFDGEWEVVDDVLNYSYLSTTTGYEIKSVDGTYTLTQVDKPYIVLEKKE